MSKTLFTDKKNCCRETELRAKEQIIKITVWNVALYVAETLVINYSK